MWLVDKLKESADLILAGTLGSFIAIYFYPDLRTRSQKVKFVITGAILSYYGGRFLIAYYKLENDALSSFFGFIIGIFGATLIQSTKRAFDAMDLLEIIKWWFPFLRGKQ